MKKHRKTRLTVLERFMQYVQKADNGCWLWTGGLDKDGYGMFGWPSERIQRASHASYRLFKGQLPEGKPWHLHTCDTPACVNPDHLFAGTYRDNIDDMLQKGRTLTGESNHQSKLTDQQASEIRSRLGKLKPGRALGQTEPHPDSSRSLAREFGVSRSVVQSIRRGTTWKHVA